MNTKPNLSAIPTKGCDGYQYRSRIEARCALFLATLGISYKPEPQPFLIDSTPYLPDFAIFLWTTLWAEVKGAFGVDPDGEAKFRSFITSMPRGTRGVLLTEMAAEHVWDWECLVIGSEGDGGYWEDKMTWAACPDGYHFEPRFPVGDCEHCGPEATRGDWNDRDERLEKAYQLARNHRFWQASSG